MKVSIVVPVYNAGRHLGPCLDSLLRQTLAGWEAICVDDGSTDGSGNILDEYARRDARIVVHHLANGGAGAARNFALSRARGRWIGFVDSDDWVSEDYFESLVACAEASEADIAATSNVVTVDESGETKKDMGIGSPEAAVGTFGRIRMFLATGSACNKIYRAEFLKGSRIRFPESCCAAEDNGFTLKALATGAKVATTDAGRYHYRTVAGSLTHKSGSASDERSAGVFRELLSWVETSVPVEERRLWCGAIAVRAEGFPGFHLRTIASLTSYPARIATVCRAIESLKAQTVRPDKIVLWLSEDDFPERELPTSLTGLVDEVFEIRWVKGDMRSHKKYFYALREFASDLVMTFDDDFHYPPQAVGDLLQSFRKFPDCVSARRAHLIALTPQGGLAPYNEWEQECRRYVGVPLHSLCATTGAGTLFPPYAVPPSVLDESRIRRLAFSADDLWLKFATLVWGMKTVVCSADADFGNPIDDGTRAGLWRENVLGGGNDACLRKLVGEFGEAATLAKLIAEQAEFGRRGVVGLCLFRLRKRLELTLLIRKENLIAQISVREAVGESAVALKLVRAAVGGALCLVEHGVAYTIRRMMEKRETKR